MNRHVTTAAIALAAAALVTGCSAATTGASDTAQNPKTGPIAQESSTVDKAHWPTSTPRNGLAKGLSLPLEDYMQTYQDTVALDNGARDLQKKCMADYGLTITLPPAGSTPPPNDNDANIERRYGITDRDTAEKYGYGLPDYLVQNPQGAKLPTMTVEETEVFSGYTSLNPRDLSRAAAPATFKGKKIHENGCAGWADSQLGGTSADFSLASELNGQSLAQSLKEPVVQEVIADWSKCMSGKGYTVDSPYDADKVVVHIDGSPSQDEIDVAVADIDCKEATDLVKVWNGTETAIQQQLIADHRSELAKPKESNASAVAAAQKALVK
ncbi:hypothetical protein [Streptomyces sp. NBC_00209]|uniref:hypothetical protein n=1 Tax=Streptomyces sp. NBC_00209 TaxID=2975682 RepID=UPI003252933D